jgi:hypothetical protein
MRTDFARKTFRPQIDVHRLIEAVAVAVLAAILMLDLGSLLP